MKYTRKIVYVDERIHEKNQKRLAKQGSDFSKWVRSLEAKAIKKDGTDGKKKG